jgi:transcriptional antiterminator NusG
MLSEEPNHTHHEAAEGESPAKTKNLSAGLGALRSSGPLKGGVATSRAVEAASTKNRDKVVPHVAPPTPRADESAAPADPDGELPMYRDGMDWFVLRVASNKENSVQSTLERKVQIEGMRHLVGRIMVPTEKTKTIKAGKQRVTETKLYPGYVFVEMKLEPD